MNDTKLQIAQQALERFLNTSLDTQLDGTDTITQQEHLLTLFQTVVQTVPAYRLFLAEHGIRPESVQTIEDFRKLPATTKKNYMQRHQLHTLCRNGELVGCDFIAVSSGSTGQPTFWPRFISDELHIATRFEQVFHDSFFADQRRTLAVVCFALGTWVGGMYTANCCRYLAAKGYPITVVTPGNNREDIFRIVQELGPAFDQVVLLGYPPALKDIVDHGRTRGIDWARYQVKFVMAGEVFSEEWRTLLGERTGSQQPCYDVAALYGTADAGVLANETPLSICIRRYLAARPDVARELFGESRLPTLAQYDPHSRFFETEERSLLFSGDNGIPLIRYNILDTGGVIPFENMLAFLAAHGFDPIKALGGSTVRGIRPLPFVFVFGRSDFTVSFFGANIYPENVTVGLERHGVKEWVTGKFVLEVREDADRNRTLAIVIELAPGEPASDTRRNAAAESIRSELLRLNSEFAAYVPSSAQTPLVELVASADAHWFPAGVKHRYTRRGAE